MFKNKCITEINTLEECLKNRILPAFNNIHREAEQVQEEEYKKINQYINENSDQSEIDEHVYFMGVEYLSRLESAKQSIINMFAMAYYHLFQQQLLEFLRHQIVFPFEKENYTIYDISKIHERLKTVGIDIKSLSSWAKLNELRIISNTIKHAEGGAASELKQLRPDLFEMPSFRNHPEAKIKGEQLEVYRPLLGEDLYLTLDDFKQYTQIIKKFWEELYIIYHRIYYKSDP
jgi:hypothetical protein